MVDNHPKKRAYGLKNRTTETRFWDAKGMFIYTSPRDLPDDWNYTTRGLAKICKEGVDAIGAALRELEGAGYIVRHQRRDKSGRITDTEYVYL